MGIYFRILKDNFRELFCMSVKLLHKLANACPFDFKNLANHPSTQDKDFLGQGADLSVHTLLNAYRCGVFPWFQEDEPILWWSPVSRCVIKPSTFKPSKSLIRYTKKQTWTLTTNHDFFSVINACSQPRSYSQDTWITQSMKNAYQDLHDLGAALSVEIWESKPHNSELIGGLYGVNIGGLFCGESMFHKKTNASKIAFWGLMTLCQKYNIQLVDCQLENPYLISLGATLIPKKEFLRQINTLTTMENCGLYDRKIQLPVTDLTP